MVHFMRRGFESHTYLQFTPAKPDSFRAECPGFLHEHPKAIHLLVPFTVRTKEPADVFPRRARLGPPRDITEFASAPFGVARRIPV